MTVLPPTDHLNTRATRMKRAGFMSELSSLARKLLQSLVKAGKMSLRFAAIPVPNVLSATILVEQSSEYSQSADS